MTALTGTWTLARAWIRRDRIRLSVWALILPLLNLAFVRAFEAIAADEGGAAARAALIATSSGTVFAGPGYGLDHYDLGPMLTNELLIYYEIALAVGAILLVARGTRAEEEQGRAELVCAAAVGRHAPLAAAIGVVTALCMAAGVGLGLSYLPAGLPAPDAMASGLGVGVTGVVFAAITALTAQLARSARGAAGAAVAVMGAAFCLRAAGDVQRLHGSALSWCSPLAWPVQTRAFTDLRWWPLAVSAGAAVVIGTAAAGAARRREHGAGLIPNAPGRLAASRALNGPVGLAWRLSRGSWAAWAVGGGFAAAAIGPMTGGLDAYLRDNPAIARAISVDPTAAGPELRDAFVAMFIAMLAVLAVWFTCGTVARLQWSETSGLAEQVLAAPVSRTRWLVSTWIVGVLGGLGVLGVTGVWLGATVPRGAGEPVTWTMASHLSAAASYTPAVVATAGLAAALYAIVPSAAVLNWVVLAGGFTMALYGHALGLPAWAPRLAPISAIPPPLGAAWDVPATAWVTTAGIALTAAALIAIVRRDIPAREGRTPALAPVGGAEARSALTVTSSAR
ncbi:MAG: hypothetical protein LBK59_02880 [Bifidobacteriaceae bacterium]|jgi:ABC-2 type transport system permease protein|nr:hypothetical protein [Bifidobacteriaceae bacterium]